MCMCMRGCASVCAPEQHMRRFILERAERMEVEQMFRDAGLPWPICIPEEETARAAKGLGKEQRPRIEKIVKE